MMQAKSTATMRKELVGPWHTAMAHLMFENWSGSLVCQQKY
jgi:hypothetical protein